MSDSSTFTFVVTIVVAFVVLRWYMTSESSGSDSRGRTTSTSGVSESPINRRPVTQDMIEVVQAIAPSLTVEQIRYDLQRTGNVSATVERYLAEGRLPFPPDARNRRPVASGGSGSSSGSSSSSNIPRTHPQSEGSSTSGTARDRVGSVQAGGSISSSSTTSKNDLISQYNLHDKIKDTTEDILQQPLEKIQWDSSKEERQAALQRQRQQMILKARKRMELKEVNEDI